MLQDQGGFGGGFWPPGYHPRGPRPGRAANGPLGDISRAARFEVDDPTTAVSDSGRIEVRVTGVAADPNFGQAGVFVSARVTGVIGE